MFIFKVIVKCAMVMLLAFVIMFTALNISVVVLNNSNAEAMKNELAKRAQENGLYVVDAYCKVGRFEGNGNGTEYLAVIFLSEVPKERDWSGWNGCRLYSPEDYEDKYGHWIAPPEDYECAAVKVNSSENFALHEFDLRGH